MALCPIYQLYSVIENKTFRETQINDNWKYQNRYVGMNIISTI